MKTQLSAVWICAGLVLSAAERRPSVTVRLASSVQLSPATVAKAQKIAAYVLRDAGVDLAWQTCAFGANASPGDSCSRLEPVRYWLYLENEKQGSTSHGMLGYTVVNQDETADLRVAGVFYPRLQAMAERFRLEEHLVLGAALAHEVGHMLGLGHTPEGIMSPSFERRHIEQAASGLLRFTGPHMRQLRTLAAVK